ncbi:MAG: hypothetical protein QW230_03875 [Thermofilum sp.]
MDVVLPLIGLAVVFIAIVIAIAELSAHLMHRRKLKLIRELAEKNPEIAKALIEEKAVEKRVEKRTLPFAKRAKVTVLLNDGSTMEDVCRFKGGTLRCKNIGMQFVVPEDYSPSLAMIGKKLYPHYVFDERGVALKVKLNNRGEDVETAIDEYVPDPRITESVIGQQALQQVFRQLSGFSFSSMIAGIGVGLLLTYIVIFVVLPLMNVPVTIGRTPVEVTIQTPPQWPGQLPPPGNYTPTG